MSSPLLEISILGAAFLPWVAEVIWQLGFQARFIEALPESVRAALPPHPRRPWLAVFASPRFHLALWRYARVSMPGDPERIVRMKRAFRNSLRRELLWISGAACVLVVLLIGGWRPPWP